MENIKLIRSGEEVMKLTDPLIDLMHDLTMAIVHLRGENANTRTALSYIYDAQRKAEILSDLHGGHVK